MLAEKRLRVACGISALFLSSWAAAQTQVFVDNFNNGSVTDSDTVPGFWQVIPNSASTVSEGTGAGGGETLLAQSTGTTGDNYPFAQISSTSLLSSANFFQQPIVLQVSGLNYNTSLTSALTQFNFGSQLAVPDGTIQTEYNEPSDFSLEILPLGSTYTNNTGTHPAGQVIMGEKAQSQNHSTPWDRYQLIGPIGPSTYGTKYGTQLTGGQVRSFELVLSSQFYYLVVTSDTSPTNSTPVTQTYFASLNLMNTGTNPWTTGAYAPGDPEFNIETQIGYTTNGTDQASMTIKGLTLGQMTMTWTNAGGDGNWFTAGNWSGLSGVIDSTTATTLGIGVPDYTSASATLPQASAPTTINIDNGGGNTVTIGTLAINSTQPYTINSTAFQLATNGSTGQIIVTAGAHTINAADDSQPDGLGNINLYGNTSLNIATGASLTLNGFLYTQDATHSSITKTGGGLANVVSLYFFSSVNVTGGTLRIVASPTPNLIDDASYINAMTISGDGHLDLANNDMVIDYTGSSPLATIRQYLRSGALLSSSASLAAGTTIGYAEAEEISQTNGFNGVPTDSTSVCMMYTYEGDLNLDGVVNSTDASLMNSGNGTDWFQGDLNYDGVKNADDWSLFLIGVAESAHGVNLAPEPGSVSMVALAATALIRRRKRC